MTCGDVELTYGLSYPLYINTELCSLFYLDGLLFMLSFPKVYYRYGPVWSHRKFYQCIWLLQVMNNCHQIPEFTPVASFQNDETYHSQGGEQSGIFLACIQGGFQVKCMLTQVCRLSVCLVSLSHFLGCPEQ